MVVSTERPSTTADAPFLAPRPRHRVDRRFWRDGGVEPGVEDGNVRDVREPCAGIVQRCQGGCVVQRRELFQFDHPAPNPLVHQHRIAVGRSTVDDAMPDRGDVLAVNTVQ